MRPHKAVGLRDSRRFVAIAVVMVACLAAASCSRSKHSASSKSTTTTTGVAPTAIPCTAADVSNTSTTTTTATTTTTPTKSTGTTTQPTVSHDATWTGVIERVHASLNEDGSVGSTPSQFTRASAAGTDPVTVHIPMSDSNLHRRDKGKKPSVANGVAQVALDPNGTSVQEFDSDFKQSLPVTVTVSFKLNGAPVKAGDVKSKSGLVEMDYKLTNTTSEPVTVCFKGFDGKVQQHTVVTPQPIVANLSFTIPSNATSFAAPGAALSTDSGGVSAGWTNAMFEPLGPTTQTFSFTMSTTKASIPKATLLLLTIDPRTISGNATSKSAAAIGKAQADALSALAAVDKDLASLQEQASQIGQGGGRSSDRSSNRGGGPARPSVGASERTARSTPNPTTTTTTTVDPSDPANIISPADVATVRAAADKVQQSIAALTTQNAGIQNAATTLTNAAHSMTAEVGAIQTAVESLVARLPAPLQKALAVRAEIARLKLDLDAFDAAQKATPAFKNLAIDLAVAETLAATLNTLVTDVQQRVDAIRDEIEKLQTDIASLEQRAAALEAAAIAAAKSTISTDFNNAIDGFNKSFDDVKARFQTSVQALERDASKKAAQAAAAAQASLNSAKANAAHAKAVAQKNLDDANAAYAWLLALDQQAELHQLPGGNASPATLQNGHYRYDIAGS